MSMRLRVNRRRSTKKRHNVIALREKRDVIAALLSLPYLDAEQSAVISQISASTIRRACVDGGLVHTRVNGGKLIRIRPDDLMLWLRADRAPEAVVS